MRIIIRCDYILKQHHGSAFHLTKYDEVKAKAQDETGRITKNRTYLNIWRQTNRCPESTACFTV
jgi:hypothetical protein